MESLSIRKRKRPKPGKSKPSAPHPPAQKHGKKRRKKRKRGEAKVAASLPPEETHKEEKGKGRKKGKSLVARFRTRLEGSQFRCLNEELYTRRSDSAFHLVKQNAALFDIYHKGFQAQVRRWPSNPVHVILQVSALRSGYRSSFRSPAMAQHCYLLWYTRVGRVNHSWWVM